MKKTGSLATKLGQVLLDNNLKIVTAESCTGGGIAHAITDIAGSSQWFECGFVAYSNESKTAQLQVPWLLIHQHGAVSVEVAKAMAQGALAVTSGTIAISATGIAGPGGQTPTKPLGFVCFALATKDVTITEQQVFSGDRYAVREQAILFALDMLVTFLA